MALVSRALQALEIANTSSCPWFVHLFGKLGLFNTSSILPISIFLVSSPSHLTMTSHFPFLATSYFLDCQQAGLQTGRRTSARCHSEEGAFGTILPLIPRHSLSSAQPARPGHCCVPGLEQGISVTQWQHEEGTVLPPALTRCHVACVHGDFPANGPACPVKDPTSLGKL